MRRNPVPWLISGFCFCLLAFPVSAQENIPWLKNKIAVLAGDSMSGRGYVEGGGKKAADWIAQQFREYGLRSFVEAPGYMQPYGFPVNTFPGTVTLQLNRQTLVPGRDFLVHGASRGVSLHNQRVQTILLGSLRDTLAWDSVKRGFSREGVYLLRDIDKLMALKKLNLRSLAMELDKGVYIIPMAKKLTWLVTTDTARSTILLVEDSVMPRKVKRISATIQNEFIPAFETQNVLGYVRGTEKPDSVIVFSAHYDHLGKMGKQATFNGANDNASGTAMLLYMARHYAAHPGRYSIAFMAFSGEEAGLLGSTWYAAHPVFPLWDIRFVLNMDMMGDATKGITIVNAPANAAEYNLLKEINARGHYVPDVLSRDQTRNSDHFPFSQKGVPAVFIYTNGVKPWYHDIHDRPEEVNFENGEGVIRLLQEFTDRLQRK